MKITTHAVHFHPHQPLVRFIEEHLHKLETFHGKLLKGEVFLRVNNQAVNNKTVEIKLAVPGHELFASNEASSFEAATLRTLAALKSQLKKFKTKISKR
ncbi:MAG: HPF/RaiA family ribosome-associated protein [Bacteroidota bacterium]